MGCDGDRKQNFSRKSPALPHWKSCYAEQKLIDLFLDICYQCNRQRNRVNMLHDLVDPRRNPITVLFVHGGC